MHFSTCKDRQLFVFKLFFYMPHEDIILLAVSYCVPDFIPRQEIYEGSDFNML